MEMQTFIHVFSILHFRERITLALLYMPFLVKNITSYNREKLTRIISYIMHVCCGLIN